MTGLPAEIQTASSNPAGATNFAFFDNGAVTNGSLLIQAGSGTIIFYKGTSQTNTWTASGTKGITAPFTCTYNLN